MAKDMEVNIKFEKAFNNYSDMLYRLALSHTGNHDDAQDVTQDVFLKYIRHGGLYNDEHERAWLIRVTINACRDLIRKNKHRVYEPLEDYMQIETPMNEVPDVVSLMEGLPVKLKTVVVLHYLEGFSVKEVAKILHIGTSAVKMRLNRARKQMADKMKSEY